MYKIYTRCVWNTQNFCLHLLYAPDIPLITCRFPYSFPRTRVHLSGRRKQFAALIDRSPTVIPSLYTYLCTHIYVYIHIIYYSHIVRFSHGLTTENCNYRRVGIYTNTRNDNNNNNNINTAPHRLSPWKTQVDNIIDIYTY